MSDLPEVIAIPKSASFVPPGRHEPLAMGGELVRHDGFWRWAQAQDLINIVEDPGKVAQFKRQHSPDGNLSEGDEQTRLEREQELEAARAELAELVQKERKVAAARESELLEKVERARQAAAEADKARADAEAKLLEASKPVAEVNNEPTPAPSAPVEEAKKSKK